MASLPMRAGQHQSQQTLGPQEMEGKGADLDFTVGVQLIAKTRRLSIASGPGREVEVFAGPAGSDRPLASETPACYSSANAQPYAATLGEWREDAPPAISATAALVAVTAASCSSMVPACAGARVVDGDVSVAGVSVAGVSVAGMSVAVPPRNSPQQLLDLPNEVLFHILGYLEVCDLLATSRVRPTLFRRSEQHPLCHPPLSLLSLCHCPAIPPRYRETANVITLALSSPVPGVAPP
jgi:hypothetical protein